LRRSEAESAIAGNATRQRSRTLRRNYIARLSLMVSSMVAGAKLPFGS
jgi:hypothetical protein